VQATGGARKITMTDDSDALRTVPGALPAPDSRTALLRHRAGDREAFAMLVAEYRRPVYSYLIRCGVAEADRDDLFQSVFLRIHRAAGQYRPELPVHPWIFTIVANEVRSHLRRGRIRQLVFGKGTDAPAGREPVDPAPDSERAAQARETVAWLEEEIRRLPLPQREVLILASLEGRPLTEVAQALELPLNTVKTHLRRARLALAHKLAQRQAAAPDKERS
jgi:RNA polymerase sigma-70 factor (ECF subfamily)